LSEHFTKCENKGYLNQIISIEARVSQQNKTIHGVYRVYVLPTALASSAIIDIQ